MVDQRIAPGQAVEAPIDLEVVVAVLRSTQMALGEENPDVHWEQEGAQNLNKNEIIR